MDLGDINDFTRKDLRRDQKQQEPEVENQLLHQVSCRLTHHGKLASPTLA